MHDTIDNLSDQLGKAAEALSLAVQLLTLALAILVVYLFTILSDALRALATLARPAALLACAALACYGSVRLYLSLSIVYGDDPFAQVLAIAMTAIIPTAMFTIAEQPAAVFPILLASGCLSWLLSSLLLIVPQPVTGLLPGVALTGCILYLTFNHQGDTL
jgi:hypothetical protein